MGGLPSFLDAAFSGDRGTEGLRSYQYLHALLDEKMTKLRFMLGAFGALIGCLLVAPVAFAALVFAGFAALTRVFVRIFEPRFERWDELIEFEPHVGWKPRANVRSHHLAEDVYQVATDADGWRGSSSVVDSQVVVFGDSFAWGHGIDDANLPT
jgi:hypothetical protein